MNPTIGYLHPIVEDAEAVEDAVEVTVGGKDSFSHLLNKLEVCCENYRTIKGKRSIITILFVNDD